MTERTPSPEKAAREAEKARRLAEALRANLARRKARSRSRAAGEDPVEPAPGAGGAGEKD